MYELINIALLVAAVVASVWILFALFLVNVGGDEIALTERRFIGPELDPGRVFARGAQVGVRASYLAPGLHFIPWPVVYVLGKRKFESIAADELGIVESTDGEQLPAGRIFADDPAGESHNNFQDPVAYMNNGGIRGKQLRFLTNGTFKIHPFLFKITKIKKTFIPEGRIGVVTANDGATLPLGQLLGSSVVGHDNFQNAELFLKHGGQKGPQIEHLRPGTYNINTEIFQVEIKQAVSIREGEIGIVEALDGNPMQTQDVVVTTPENHSNFQNGELFIKNGGNRGPQETILTPGTYYINPYLFAVTKDNQTVVVQGEVAVLISNIGKDPATAIMGELNDERGGGAKHVVSRGYRGIQKEVLGPGVYNINTLAYSVIKVPTVTRSVDWSAEENKPEQTRTFDPFNVVSHDGFEMKVEVRCQYRIQPENAPYVIQRIGSVDQLELNAIHPQIDGIFRAQVSKSPAISYQQNRAAEQKSAEEAVREDLSSYRVEVISVMITNIHLPEALMRTTQQKNLAEQEKSMYDAKRETEVRRIEFEKSRAEADQQLKIVTAETGIMIAKHEARQIEERARGDAARVKLLAEADANQIKQVGDSEAGVIRAKGEAQAKAYHEQVNALTASGVTTVEVIKAIAAANLKITPDILITGGANGGDAAGNGLVNVLLGKFIQDSTRDKKSVMTE